MKTITLLILIILVIGETLFAQDLVIKRNGEEIKCKVTEVGSEEIKFIQPDYRPDLTFTVNKSEVDRILFGEGQEIVIDHAARAMESAENNSGDLFLIQRKNAIKAEFLSPIWAVTSVTYERALKPGQSIEVAGAVVGLGFNNEDNAAGFGAKAGYKFIRSPDFYMRGMRYAHILKGGYVKPEMVFAHYRLEAESENITKFGVLITMGKQWVFSDIFLVDLYWGIGYGGSNGSGLGYYPYVFAAGDSDVPIAASAGFRIGILL